MNVLLPTKRFALSQSYLVFAGVFLVRLVTLVRLSNSAFLLPTRGDMHFYNDWAQRILQGGLTDHAAFYGLPLYAYLLALLYKIFGFNPLVPGLLQALLDAGTGVLIYKFASQILARQPNCGIAARVVFPWLAAAGWAFFAPAQAYSVILMPTAWLTFVFWLIVWRLVRADNPPPIMECLLLGLLIGVTAMGVATILFLVPLVVAALFLKPKLVPNRLRRACLVGCGFLFLGVVAGAAPCWIHNYVVARDPVMLSAHSGVNFWIGNNPEANGYPRFPPGLRAGQAAMLQDSITVAESAAGRPLKRAEVSAYWSAKAKDYIRRHPGAWLELLLIKLRNVVNAFQYDDLSVITPLREQGIMPPGIYFGIVIALALPGIFLAWRLAPQSRWIIAAIALHIAALLTVFVTERYRLPIVPGLLVFAVFGLFVFWQSLLQAQYQKVVAYIALLISSTFLVSWPQRNPSLWALDAYNSGWQALEASDLPLAEKKLALAYSYVPGNAETNFALGNLRLAQGHPENAKVFYFATLQIDREHKGAANNLGVVALDAGNFQEALSWLQHALAIAPRDSKTHYLLAKTFRAGGNESAAKEEIEKAIELNPAQPEFLKLREQLRRSGNRQ